MSGHSHFATIKRKKETEDAKKGATFSRLSKIISIAIKTGGSADPDSNYKLRMAIDQAKMANMPKSNVERILERAQEEGKLDEVVYEGYGPENVAVIVEAATDNKNRTAQEIKNIFERSGGSLAGPGSVSFNFESRGLVVIKKNSDPDSQMLDVIDLGVDDVIDTQDDLEVYVKPQDTAKIKDKLIEKGYEVLSFAIVKKPKTSIKIDDPQRAKKLINFLDSLEEHDDVENVFSNADIEESVV